eukprot:m.18754 g.18754  ORF g.18754 m.18754 type:complete len:429 (-) comp9729_c0_seq1:117-1403(-)
MWAWVVPLVLLIGGSGTTSAVDCGARVVDHRVVLEDAWVSSGWPGRTGVWTDPGPKCNEHTFYGYFGGEGCCNSSWHLRYAFNVHDLLERWANQRVMFFGDSVTQQQIDALVILVEATGGSITRFPQKKKKGDYDLFRINPQNVTLLRDFQGGGCVSPTPVGAVNGCTYPSHHTVFESMVAQSDIVYVNVGLHVENSPMNQVRGMFEYIKGVLERPRASPKPRNFYRTTFPQHFASQDAAHPHGHSFRHGHGHGCVGYGVATDRFWTNDVALEVFRNSTTVVIDLWEFLERRGDLHSKGNRQDCTHFCWNPDMWNGVFYSFGYAIDVVDHGEKNADARCRGAKEHTVGLAVGVTGRTALVGPALEDGVGTTTDGAIGRSPLAGKALISSGAVPLRPRSQSVLGRSSHFQLSVALLLLVAVVVIYLKRG